MICPICNCLGTFCKIVFFGNSASATVAVQLKKVGFSLLLFPEFVLRCSKVSTAAGQRAAPEPTVCVCPLWHMRNVNTWPTELDWFTQMRYVAPQKPLLGANSYTEISVFLVFMIIVLTKHFSECVQAHFQLASRKRDWIIQATLCHTLYGYS